MVTYLGSLVQLCCGEGGTQQTSIAGMYGECSQHMNHTGFATAQGGVCFLGLHFSGPGCSAGHCPKWALHFMHFAGLSCSCSRVLHKGTDLVGR